MELNNKFASAKILIVDDQLLSNRLLEEILRKGGFLHITTITDPREVRGAYERLNPDLLILDLDMPYLNGFQVMEQLKFIEENDYLPIIVISGEENPETRFNALESGAKDFLHKPYDRVEVLLRISNLIEVRMLHNEVRNQNKILEERVQERTQALYATQLDVIERLSRAVEFRDLETGLHTTRMSHYSACIARGVGFGKDDLEMILAASPLHDIGKIGIPDSILLKPGKLTPQEWEIMKTHTTIGAELLSGSDSKFLHMAREIALTHHEKWDGSGYPHNLQGEEIPLVGRICGLCDVFDALMNKRPYKDAWTMEQTLDEIRKCRGVHFDSRLVDCFFDLLPQIVKTKEQYDDEDQIEIPKDFKKMLSLSENIPAE